MPDQTVIRTETIEGRTYALVDVGFSASCRECAFYRQRATDGCAHATSECVLTYQPVTFGRYIELPHADRGE